MQGPFLRKYATQTTVIFALYKIDGSALQPAATFAAGDVKVMLDEAAEANATNLPTDEGQTYSIVITAAQMTAARVMVILVDQTSPQLWLDTTLCIETYGHASAMHAFDLGTASTAQTGDSFARIGAAGASLSAIPWNAAWDAEVQSEVNDELILQNLDHLLKTATAGVDMTTEVTDGSVVSRMISNSDTSLFVPATHSMQIVGADVAAVHTHVGTIDGHITADYGATEKTCIDLLDDAAGGLADIHTDIGTIDTVVDGIETHVHATDGHITADYGATEKTCVDLLDDAAGGLADIHTDIGTIDTVVDGIETHVHATDGHITADYGATEKTCVDLLDDASGGLADIHTDVETAVTDIAAVHVHVGTDGVVVAAASKTGYALSATGADLILKGSTFALAIADAVLDEVIEGALTLRREISAILAAASSKASGGGTATVKFRNVADTKDRITLTVDADGNRSASVLDVSDIP